MHPPHAGEPAGEHRSLPAGTLALFGAGDFAFNLYWQTTALYLLFFYMEVLRLPPATAGAVFMAGLLWDGVADLGAGIAAERVGGGYRRLIALATGPLAVAFVLLFVAGGHGAAWALAAQMLFHAAYAAANIPYAAWTVRLAATGPERSQVAGWRMGFGATAACLVGLGLPALAGALASYPAAAALLAMVASVVLAIVLWRVPEPRRPAAPSRIPVGRALSALLRERAFVLLNLAAMLGGAAAALLGQSVLYVFRYLLADPVGGPQALALMGLVSVAAVPAWTWLASRRGGRAVWLAAGMAALVLIAAAPIAGVPRSGSATLAFFVLMQAAFAGTNLAAWSLLPDAIDWGEVRDGVRAEALAYGVFALVQKAALAGAGLAIGTIYGASGFVGGAAQAMESRAAIGTVMLAGPALLIGAMLAAAWALPLGRVIRRA